MLFFCQHYFRLLSHADQVPQVLEARMSRLLEADKNSTKELLQVLRVLYEWQVNQICEKGRGNQICRSTRGFA